MQNNINHDHAHNDGLLLLDNELDSIMTDDVTNLISRKFISYNRSIPNSSIPDLIKFYYELEDLRVSLLNFNNSSIFKSYSHYLKTLENVITPVFQNFNSHSITGNWAVSQDGIGHATSVSLLSFIDISKAPTVNAVWRYCGLDPKQTESNSWNPFLKNLCWKIGKSFVEFPDSFYGQLYFKEYDRRINLNKAGNYSEDIPQSRIEAQSRRYATKIFLSHWHQIRYQELNGIAPSSFVKTETYIAPPNNPFE